MRFLGLAGVALAVAGFATAVFWFGLSVGMTYERANSDLWRAIAEVCVDGWGECRETCDGEGVRV